MLNPGVAESFRRVGRDLRSWTAGEAVPVLAVRSACGIAATMVAVELLGGPGWGLAAAMGSWLGGVAMVTPGTRTGPAVPLSIGAVGAGALLVGSFDQPVVLVAAAGLYAFALTFIGSVSQSTGVMLTVSGILIFLSDHLTEGAPPPVAAAAVCAGGAVQAAISLLPPYYRWAEDRRALADVWTAMAEEASALAADPNAPFRTGSLVEAAGELDRRRALPAAIVEARRQIYAVSTAIARVASARARADARERDTVAFYGAALGLASRLLHHFSSEITARRPTAVDWDELLDELAHDPVATSTGTIPSEIAGLLRTLHDTGRFAERINSGSDEVVADPALAHATGRAREALRQLRSRWRWSDATVQHSARRAAVVAAAMTVGMALPLGHGYWVPLTAWLVLQADFAGTLTRGVTRAVGTLGGVVAASLLSLAVPHTQLWLTAMVLGFAAAAYLSRPVSMLVFAAAVAGFTVFQIDLSGEDPVGAALDRGVSTAIGASLSIGFYALVPTWQTRRLGELLGGLVDSYRDYARLVLDRQAHPVDYDRRLTHAVIDDLRGKRAKLNTAADQAAAEPVAGPGPLSADALGAEAALSRAARALVAINATLGREEDAPALPGVDEFADAVDAAYLRLAALARGGARPASVDLGEAAERLDAALAEGDGSTRTRRGVIRWEVDNLTEALEDAALLMASWGRP